MIKLMCFDLDNTLLNEGKKIGIETLQGLKSAIKGGVKAALVTGRVIPSTVHYANLVDPSVISVSYNGSVLYIPEEGRIDLGYLPASSIRGLIQYGEEHRLYYQFYDRDIIIPKERGPALFRDPDLKNVSYRMEEKENIPKLRSPKGILATEGENGRKVRRDLEELFFDTLNISMSKGNIIEINPRGIGKKNTLELLSKKLEIYPEEILAVGDNYNDMDMVEWAGIGCTVSNGIPELKDRADYVAEGKNTEGVLEILEKFIL